MNVVAFRPLEHDDLPLLVEWFAQPAIARWWNQPADFEQVRAKYAPRIVGREPTAMWIVEIDGQPAGFVQSYRHADYPHHDIAVGIPNAAGIDFFLDDAHRGRGLAGDVLRQFAEFVLELHANVDCCVATPAQANAPSWRALERAGFTRRHECQPPDEPRAYAYAYARSNC